MHCSAWSLRQSILAYLSQACLNHLLLKRLPCFAKTLSLSLVFKDINIFLDFCYIYVHYFKGKERSTGADREPLQSAQCFFNL